TDITSHTNNYHASSQSFSFNTNGDVAYQRSEQSAAKLPEPSGIFVESDLTEEQFHTDEVILTGGKMISKGRLDLHPKLMKVYDVNTYEKNKQYGVSFNINSFFNNKTS